MNPDQISKNGPWLNREEFLACRDVCQKKYALVFRPWIFALAAMTLMGLVVMALFLFRWREHLLAGAAIFVACTTLGIGFLGYGLVKAFQEMPRCPSCQSMFSKPASVAASGKCDRCGHAVFATK